MGGVGVGASAGTTTIVLVTMGAAVLAGGVDVSARKTNTPHVVYVLTDNLGWGGVGFLRALSPAGPTPEVRACVRVRVRVFACVCHVAELNDHGVFAQLTALLPHSWLWSAWRSTDGHAA
jgi:hypothetical protein